MSAITRNRQIPSITLKTELIGKITGRKIDANALIDSGAEGIIINGQFAQRNQLTLLPIKNPFPVRNVDGSENTMGWQVVPRRTGRVLCNGHWDHNIILGTDWLEEHNPDIDWSDSRIDMTRCPETCITAKPPVLHLKTKSLKPTVVDPRTHHKDYQVRWLEPVGRFKPIAQRKLQGDVAEFLFDPSTEIQKKRQSLLKMTMERYDPRMMGTGRNGRIVGERGNNG
ncbi:hypothetical protein D9758_015482 [Tetrapyrgos nigripes]|uniref:Uncharacterized protein n=1 Tax=Tetrapyrgos nigripes TaxID=182062 RepID=A0A8H5FC76_9AGAR|nr:hypothetical protein D9758_015482 [Tetrapyrgos nigripes]